MEKYKIQNPISKLSPKLYSETGILLTGILFSPLAGCYLLGQNFKTLGDAIKCRNTILLGLGVTILLVLVGYLLEDKVPDGAFVGGNIGAM